MDAPADAVAGHPSWADDVGGWTVATPADSHVIRLVWLLRHHVVCVCFLSLVGATDEEMRRSIFHLLVSFCVINCTEVCFHAQLGVVLSGPLFVTHAAAHGSPGAHSS